MFNSIVVALDLASNVHRALPVARSLAELGGLLIQLLTVSPAAGWLGDVEGALTDPNRRRQP